MGVNLKQFDEGHMGLQGTDADAGAIVFASVEYLAASVDKVFFIAPRALRVVGITLRPTIAGTDAGAVTVQVEKLVGVVAVTAGVDLMSATLNLKGTADTTQVGTLSTTAGALNLAVGNALAVDFTGVMTVATGVVTVAMCPV